MLRCAITDGKSYALSVEMQRAGLVEKARRWAAQGIDLIQVREKHLEAGALLRLAEAMLRVLRLEEGSRTKLLVNGRADVAIAAGAHGVHLTSREGELTPEQVRAVFAQAGRPAPVVSVSCHTLEEVARAKENGADYILFGPVFEKRVGNEAVKQGLGLDLLRQACLVASPIPVLALGGVDADNTASCIAAGAGGIAAIRSFESRQGARRFSF
jgi:thiamine-phosphate pyrophosphorylase